MQERIAGLAEGIAPGPVAQRGTSSWRIPHGTVNRTMFVAFRVLVPLAAREASLPDAMSCNPRCVGPAVVPAQLASLVSSLKRVVLIRGDIRHLTLSRGARPTLRSLVARYCFHR